MSGLVRTLGEEEVAARLRGSDLVPVIESTLQALADGHIEVAPRGRLGAGPAGEVTHIRAARDARDGGLVVKATDYDPGRPGRDGGPTLLGAVTWQVRGELRYTVPAGIFTAYRTMATTCFVVDRLGPGVPTPLAMIGAGEQALAHVIGLASLGRCDEVRVVSRAGGAARLAASVDGVVGGVRVRAVDTVGEAVRGAGLVICATTSREPVVSADQLPEDSLLVLLGGGTSDRREAGIDVFARAVQVVSDDAQRACDAGSELVPAIEAETLSSADVHDLTSLMGGERAERSGLRIYKSVGAAWQDLALAAHLGELVRG